jgi:tRNA(Ser,Leu) C12 N-acetylase TAN1
MQEWNAVISVAEHGFGQAVKELSDFGSVKKTDFYNVLVMYTAEPARMLETLRQRSTQDAEALSYLSRLIPVTKTFIFQSHEDFQDKAREAVLGWVAQLAGKAFHVRMHRRGFKGRLASVEEEQFLDAAILEALEKAGAPGRITFEDPEAVIAVETVGHWAGLSLWSREDLKKYPFIRLD